MAPKTCDSPLHVPGRMFAQVSREVPPGPPDVEALTELLRHNGVRLLLAESGIPCKEVTVDITTGEHRQPPYATLNPNPLVPMLVDGDLRLTEASAILNYLAEAHGLPSYPKDLARHPRLNEMTDWLSTQRYRELGYGLVYPQILPSHRLHAAHERKRHAA